MVCVAPPYERLDDDEPEDEKILKRLLEFAISYDKALEVWLQSTHLVQAALMCTQSATGDFFDETSTDQCIRVHDGRQWRWHNDKYWVQFNWKTNSPAAGMRRFSKRQTNRILQELIAGGTVHSAIRKVTVLFQ